MWYPGLPVRAMSNQVVITGIGVVSPIGVGKKDFWSGLVRGQNGVRKITHFDPSPYRTSVGAEIQNFEPGNYLPDNHTADADRAKQLVLVAAHLAIEDAGMIFDDHNRKQAGIFIGTTTGTANSLLKYQHDILENGVKAANDCDVLNYNNESLPNEIARLYGLTGRTAVLTNACAAGNYAIGQAYDMIRTGSADVMLAGGVDAISEIAFCGFSSTRSLTRKACRPFDQHRDGLAVAEGAAILVMESLDHAGDRGARIYADVVGYGLSCDAGHMTAPDISGHGAALAIRNALRDAKMSPSEIDYICAHGTGTPANDLMETRAIKSVFGKSAYEIPVSSIKSMIGHSFGASGALSAAACMMVLDRHIIPPTINYETPDPECDLDYVPNVAVQRETKTILSNSFAFGGNNASLVFRKNL